VEFIWFAEQPYTMYGNVDMANTSKISSEAIVECGALLPNEQIN
jgi:hypothetical protein